MQNQSDGSVTLSKQEFEELSRAYKNLHNILNRQPTSLDDYFMHSRRQYVEVCKWGTLLAGRQWTEEEEKELMEGFEYEREDEEEEDSDANISAEESTPIEAQFFADRKGPDGNYYSVWQSGIMPIVGQGQISLPLGEIAISRLRWTISAAPSSQEPSSMEDEEGE